MAVAGDIVIELEINGTDFQVKLKQADTILKQLAVTGDRTSRSIVRIDRAITGAVARLRDFTIVASQIRGALQTLSMVTFGWQQSIIRANADLEKFQVLMAGMSGASTFEEAMKRGADQTKQLLGIAQQVPISISELANATAKLNSVGLDPLAGNLKALGDAVSYFGGSESEFHRAAVAITQMSGKGTVSLEELRQQLGEAVPTALQTLSRATGIEMSRMVKLISEGKLRSAGTIQKMMDQMAREFGGAGLRMMETWDGLMGRLKTSWILFAKEIADGGYFEEVKNVLRDIISYMSSIDGIAMANQIGRALTAAIRAFREFAVLVKKYIDEIIFALQVLVFTWIYGKVLGALRVLSGVIMGLVGNFRSMATAIISLNGVFAAGATASTRMSAGLGLLRGVLRTFLGPLSALIIAYELWTALKTRAVKATNDEKSALDQLRTSVRAFAEESVRAGANEEIAMLDARKKAYEAQLVVIDKATQGLINLRNEASAKGDDAGAEILAAQIRGIATARGVATQAIEGIVKQINDGRAQIAEGQRFLLEEGIGDLVDDIHVRMGKGLQKVQNEFDVAMKAANELLQKGKEAEYKVMATDAIKQQNAGIKQLYEERILAMHEQLAALATAGKAETDEYKRIHGAVVVLTTEMNDGMAKAGAALTLFGKENNIVMKASTKETKELKDAVRDLDRFYDGLAESILTTRQQIANAAMSDAESFEFSLQLKREAMERYLNEAKAGEEERARHAVRFAEWEAQQRVKQSHDVHGALRKNWQDTLNVEKNFFDASAQWAEGFTDVLTEMAMTGKGSFSDLANSIVADIIRMTLRAQIYQIIAAALGWINGGSTGATSVESGIPLVASPGPTGGLPALAMGGIVGPKGEMPLNKYALGGVARSPQLAIFGEGSMPEAFVPLPDGRTIPVTMDGGEGQQPNMNVQVNIINESGTPLAGEEQGRRFDGERMVLDIVAKAANRPGSFRDSLRGAVTR